MERWQLLSWHSPSTGFVWTIGKDSPSLLNGFVCTLFNLKTNERENTLGISFQYEIKGLEVFSNYPTLQKNIYVTVFTHWKKKRKALLLAKCTFYILDLQMVDLSFKNVKIFMFFIADTWHNRLDLIQFLLFFVLQTFYFERNYCLYERPHIVCLKLILWRQK